MAKGINPDYLDIDVNPEKDFYQYVNGGWMKATEIPPDRGSWGSFHELAKQTDEKNLELLDSAIENGHQLSNKAAIFYQSGMNIEQIEKEKLSAVAEIFDVIASCKNLQDLSKVLGSLTAKGLGGILHFSVHPDLGNSHIYAS